MYSTLAFARRLDRPRAMTTARPWHFYPAAVGRRKPPKVICLFGELCARHRFVEFGGRGRACMLRLQSNTPDFRNYDGNIFKPGA